MRLIDADAFRDYVLKNKLIGLTICEYSESDILYMIKQQPTIAQTPNDPLTLSELREMDGEPVWLEYDKCWVLVLVNDGIPMLGNLDGERCKAENWIGLWGNIYRHKPEEGTVWS